MEFLLKINIIKFFIQTQTATTRGNSNFMTSYDSITLQLRQLDNNSSTVNIRQTSLSFAFKWRQITMQAF